MKTTTTNLEILKSEIDTLYMNTLEQTAATLGFTLEAGSPSPHNAEGWQAIAYPVTISRNGKPVFSTLYKMGVGHFEKPLRQYIKSIYSGKPSAIKNTLTIHGTSVISRLKPADQQNALNVVTAAAKHYQVKPQLADVLASLLMDGGADFDAESFEDWSANYGHDTDSRKAEKIYFECVKTGQAIRRHVTPEELETLRNLANEL